MAAEYGTVVNAENVVAVGYGDFGTKSSEVRAKMAKRLAESVRAALADADLPGTVERRWARILVETDETDPVAEVIATLPGVVWARPAVLTDATVDAVRDALRTLSTERGHGSDESFAVESRRVGPPSAHPFSSRDLKVEGGSAVQAGTDAPVDLDHPDRTYRVEVRDDEAFVSAVQMDGPGGLPLGTQGRAVVLLSGGIDSPVAAWRMMRRGCSVAPVYVDLGDYGGADHRARATEVATTLLRRAPDEDVRLHVVPGGEVVQAVVDELHDTRMLSLRRAMLAAGEAVAREVGAHSVVTGESLGQKSSQTGANLAATDAAVSLPVHRPLLTADKTDIVEEARALGTFSDSTLPVGCERVAPSHPETNATVEAVEAAEPDDLLSMAREAAADRSVVDLEP
ncbi:tRNA sulfurtransferase [Halopelagius fulvigenes]|uniref:Probable tRNA sulfurtransferase n=1 Tax=Halopelagius fulvigenes TaxID=1198324 RepID=A0ABD5TYA7_9EURY